MASEEAVLEPQSAAEGGPTHSSSKAFGSEPTRTQSESLASSNGGDTSISSSNGSRRFEFRCCRVLPFVLGDVLFGRGPVRVRRVRAPLVSLRINVHRVRAPVGRVLDLVDGIRVRRVRAPLFVRNLSSRVRARANDPLVSLSLSLNGRVRVRVRARPLSSLGLDVGRVIGESDLLRASARAVLAPIVDAVRKLAY